MTRFPALRPLLAAATITAAATAATTASPPARAEVGDYQRAREAFERHEVLPLARIIEPVEREIGGRMIEVEFEEESGQYFYELELITPDGRLLEVRADAVTGRVLSVEEEDED